MTLKLEEHKILIIDDDQHIVDLLMTVFEKEGFQQLFMATTGTEALFMITQNHPHIILLDVMLPDIDGFTLCGKIRSETDVPILFLTAKITDLDKLQGFSFGGDDYITKPFNPLEVVARVKAHLKRSMQIPSRHTRKQFYDHGAFNIDANTGKLIVNGVRLECPTQELKLLLYFCEHPNKILSKHQIYKDVWGEFYGGDSTVMVHVRRLREKIEQDPSRPKWIKTVRGLGYIFEADANEDLL
ncbi:DNA-binding response regulator [Bacillus sp. J14TS2]|uniref:response regulator transcription factor n=1 Tax=Bacillus sp. J14TS2 TaxID=2807188 RepID=UPI001B08B6BD|nr:response regulator transcription factor [Bacillus sp. J14TS2]GIN73101.1 DNA-binding response regulator [Bacillus sp. J14TS2]